MGVTIRSAGYQLFPNEKPGSKSCHGLATIRVAEMWVQNASLFQVKNTDLPVTTIRRKPY